MRCEYCHNIVSAHQTHICQHGLRRNLLMDELQSNGFLDGMNVWKNSSKRWGRGV
jgi:pyruvate-formate lyase-activating enzyme